MNIDDLSKFSLGQYGSVTLDSAEQLSLIGSSKYLIGAIHILSNRESSSTDNSFQYLVANDINPLYWGTHSGGSMVLQFNGENINSTDDTIQINNSLDWKFIRPGHTCNYFARGQSDSSLGLTSCVIDGSNFHPTTANRVYTVVEKNDYNRTLKLKDSSGAIVNLTTQSPDVAGSKRALVFPAITAQTTALIEDSLDADDANHDAGPFVAGDNIVEGVILYGRWNFVKLGAYVRAVAYLIPKII
tara:strand:- start:2079 stop:2810 length:732 start_codon:yes stop_codon:yes gene_type:complete